MSAWSVARCSRLSRHPIAKSCERSTKLAVSEALGETLIEVPSGVTLPKTLVEAPSHPPSSAPERITKALLFGLLGFVHREVPFVYFFFLLPSTVSTCADAETKSTEYSQHNVPGFRATSSFIRFLLLHCLLLLSQLAIAPAL